MNPLRELTEQDLRKRTSAKWRVYDADVLPLWVAEMDTPLAPAVEAALHEAVTRGDTGYPMPEAYVEAAAGFAKQRWDVLTPHATGPNRVALSGADVTSARLRWARPVAASPGASGTHEM